MFWQALRNKYSPIGLDIGTDSIKALQLARSGGSLAVAACGRWQVPPEVRDDPVRREEVTVSAVRDLLRKGGFCGKRVATALSCEQLSIKNIRLPHLPADELTEAVKWEAAERFGFEVRPDRLKHFRAGEVRQGTELQEEIIMLAVDEEVIESHLSMLAQMGLYPVHIGAEPVELFGAFQRRLRRQEDKEAVSVLLDIGTQATLVVVARGRHIVFIRSIDIAGRRFTEATAKQLNLSFQEAAELRRLIMRENAEARPFGRSGMSSDRAASCESVNWTVRDAIRGEAEALGREVALCLRYCSVTFRGLRPQSVTITGGQAYDPSVVKLLGEQLGIECVVGQPLQGIDISKVDFGGSRRGMLADWALCTGLAARNFSAASAEQEAHYGQHRLSA